jgi:lysozyme family protein
MADRNYPTALKLVLAHEGGFVNNPKDPGGATNQGVTQAVYDAYRLNKLLPPISVHFIKSEEVTEIYRKQYWGITCDRLPLGLDYAVFDYAVNSGKVHAISDLQRALNARGAKLAVDGACGESTLAAVLAERDLELLITRYCGIRQKFLESLHTFKTFGKGWTRRVSEVRTNAIRMATSSPGTVTTLPTPAPIGAKPSEAPTARALPSDVALSRTPAGVGAGVAGLAVSGTTVIETAQQIKPHINDSWLGKLCLAAFAILMVIGVSLVIWQWYAKQREKAA